MLKPILANITLLLLRLWIVAMILPVFRRKRSIIITSLTGAIIAGSALWAAPQLIDGAFQTSAQLAQGVVRSLIIILGGISLLVSSTGWKKLIQTTLIVGLIAILGQLIISQLPGSLQGPVQFFFCIALIEEWIKYAIMHQNRKRMIQESDLIVFALLAGISYARWENILIATELTHIRARTPTYLVHMFFASIVGMSLQIQSKYRIKWIVGIGFLAAISLHTLYNIHHGQIHRSLRIVTIILRYGTLSYLLSQTDSIYLLRRDTLATFPVHQ